MALFRRLHSRICATLLTTRFPDIFGSGPAEVNVSLHEAALTDYAAYVLDPDGNNIEAVRLFGEAAAHVLVEVILNAGGGGLGAPRAVVRQRATEVRFAQELGVRLEVHPFTIDRDRGHGPAACQATL